MTNKAVIPRALARGISAVKRGGFSLRSKWQKRMFGMTKEDV
jgi:hypothetical protein